MLGPFVAAFHRHSPNLGAELVKAIAGEIALHFELHSIFFVTLRTELLDGQLVSYIHTHACTPAASRATSAVHCPRKATGPHHCSSAAGSQAPTSGAAKQLRWTRVPLGPDPVPLGPPQLCCSAAGCCLSGCGPAACGPAGFLRQDSADAGPCRLLACRHV